MARTVVTGVSQAVPTKHADGDRVHAPFEWKCDDVGIDDDHLIVLIAMTRRQRHEDADSCFTRTTGKFCGSMTRALVATSATSGLSLFCHALRFLSSQSPTAPSDSSPPSFLESPLDQICPAERSDIEVALYSGIHLPSICVGILIGCFWCLSVKPSSPPAFCCSEQPCGDWGSILGLRSIGCCELSHGA